MPKLTFFPLIIDRWVAGTQSMSFEERGFYISLLVWMYDTGSAIRNADHAAKELACNPRSARKLLGKIEHKFYRNKNGDLRHKLVDELLRTGGRLRGIQRQFESNSAPIQLQFNPNCAPIQPERIDISNDNNGLQSDHFPTDQDQDPEEDKRREEPLSVSSPHAKSIPQNLRFAEWWEAYPKKVGRKPCAAIWKRRGLDSMVDALIDDVRTRASQDAKWLDGFVPNPQTYLNQDRWEDEINTERAKASNGRKTYDDYMQNLGAGVDAGPPGEILGGNVVAVRPKVVR